MFSAEPSAIIVKVTRRKRHAGCMALDIRNNKLSDAPTGSLLEALGPVMLIRLLTVDCLEPRIMHT